jgi:hypothetical protein
MSENAEATTGVSARRSPVAQRSTAIALKLATATARPLR